MSNREEFQEIAHSGGKAVFEVRRDEDGSVNLSAGYQHTRPTPMSLTGVYALPPGVPVGDLGLAGVGPFKNQPPVAGCIPVFIASDVEGYFGHLCRHGCGRYWRSDRTPAVCPYCGARGDDSSFISDAQLLYVEHYIRTLSEALDEPAGNRKIVIDMDAVLDSFPYASLPAFYQAEKSQQCRFTCTTCGGRSDILGRFGYCSSCGTRNNLQLLRAEIERIKNAASTSEGAVRDLVAAFESCGRDYVAQLCNRIPMTRTRKRRAERIRFHSAQRTADELADGFAIEILAGLKPTDIAFAEMMFARRHVYEHRGGVADEKYLRAAGDTSVRVGQALREDADKVRKLSKLLLRMAELLDSGFHEVFPSVR